MKLIPLTQGLSAIVDDADYDRLSKHKWYAHRQHGPVYAERKTTVKGKQITIKMHREVMGNFPGVIDHIDGNGINNARSNLRFASTIENACNRKVMSTNTSGQKGVYFAKSMGKWRASICKQGKRINLGSFSCFEDAKMAYIKASKIIHGCFARN